MAFCVKVVIDDIINKIDKPYDYYVPEYLTEYIRTGIRVVVPFSKANIRKKALVLETFEKDDITGLKPVITAIDEVPVLNSIQSDILNVLKNRYFVTYFRAFKTIVPRGIDVDIKEKYSLDEAAKDIAPEFFDFFTSEKGHINFSELSVEFKKQFRLLEQENLISKQISSKSKVSDKTEKKLVLKISTDEVELIISKLEKRYSKQIDLLSVFLDHNEISYKDALYYSGCGDSTVKTLVKKSVLAIESDVVQRNPYKDIERKEDMSDITLNQQQKNVFENIAENLSEFKTHLIHGVTGSGKTLLYIALMDEVIKSGKSVIFMVPEISLTPQTLERFYTRYGEKVAIVHSGLSVGERADEWKKIKNSSQSVIVGTRSAVFSPVNNLGMVIIDEEHESSYKSESSPRFHARDISKFICKKLNIPLILGSATPSIESCYLAKKGIYSYHRMTKRFNNNPLPTAEIIDMKLSNLLGEQSFLSEQLSDAISENLALGEQTILFLNRRGTHTMVGCRSCGYVEKCPNCAVSLTYHSANNRCMCHYCGYSIKMYDKCPECSSEHIKRLGVGTQLVCSELSDMFPSARILRMDFDTVSSYIEYGRKLSSFKNGEYDIMLGTQMVAKGLDFPNVTLVGVINADISLHVDDFRANERTFSLLTQVCGRSGRAGKEGRAIIQTYSPDYEVIRYAKEQNYDKYFDFEINFRKAMNYPPFCDLIQFTVSSASENNAYDSVMELYKFLDVQSNSEFSDIPIRLLYPTAPKIAKFNNRFRYSLCIKSKVSSRLYQLLNNINEKFNENKNSDLSVNVNPMNNV